MLIFQNQLLNSSGTCGKFPSEYTFYSFGKNLTPLEKKTSLCYEEMHDLRWI